MSRFLVLYRGGDASKLSPKQNESLVITPVIFYIMKLRALRRGTLTISEMDG